MNPIQQLRARYLSWQQKNLQRQIAGSVAMHEERNMLWMPRPNFYHEYDIGTKNIRYPNGRTKSLRVTKVRDSAGIPFYTFPPSTPLS